MRRPVGEQMKRWHGIVLLVLYLLLVLGCANVPKPEQRLHDLEQQTLAYDWQRLDISASPFVLAAYLPRQISQSEFQGDKVLTVYIEGDGLAWITRSCPSSDPTPVDPIGLYLAFSHPNTRVAYLARPCQYTMASGSATCEQKYWTTHRFAPEVIAATNRAITVLMAKTSSTRLELVGYSGGGAIATLVAAQRNDVVGLRTLAGNLDHARWTKYHAVDSLRGSLNPVDVAADIASLPQLHFVGMKDSVVPREVAGSFVAKQGLSGCSEIVPVDNADHSYGWVEAWPGLLAHPLPCR